MTQPVLTVEDVMAWNERTHAEWRKLFTEHPEALAIPCDITGTKNVAELMQHIIAPEIRYAQQLSGLPIADYKDIPYDSVDAIYATHEHAMTLFRELLASDTIDWDAKFEFTTRSFGQARSTRKAVLFHALTHGIRHYAQLTTLVRQHGISHKLPQDYLVMHLEIVNKSLAG
ncbi:hypothetical protein GCM10011507_24030 [Edaphobacter acidisoli]|uniref:Damage-inducible protein DinB n=1 Tax=Edaphobacter acidisoli TaxID=2040573 RepID=A0A916RXW8_9BACT|nr:DinB family protein [Edaphobacter acidisoli]GGA71622.1 hypothetical protein GCM10011507_24030 [Edaphobacter acidisoli]